MQQRDFIDTVWGYYHEHERDLPWRVADADGSFDPYKILVSEIMLQQTQAQRVIPKYQSFLEQFPTVKSLAAAPLQAVLLAWSGLGYNRRAKFLWQAAQFICEQHRGVFPDSVKLLVALPGVGPNTAAAICAYAFNQPVVFIETNIRTIYIHHFFPNTHKVRDSELLPFITETLDQEHPREWYWALMDYGVYLKATVGNASRSSMHYAKQSRFEGSRRQIRGAVLKCLAGGPLSLTELSKIIVDDRLVSVLNDLVHESLITKQDNIFSL